jgi:YHS domain-containing protein
MPAMRTFAIVALLATTIGSSLAADATPAGMPPGTGPIKDKTHICMMQDSLQPKPGLAHQYGGKTYWLCCQMCVQAFEGDPEKYAFAKDPVNGSKVDKATAPAYAVGGRAFFFSSEDTLKTFAKNPARYLQGS